MSAISLPNSPSPLRLFSPESPPRQTSGPKLAEVFESIVRPSLIGIAQSTLAEYRRAVAKWSLYSSDPPIEEISDETCEQFCWTVRENPAIRPATYNKWARHLRGVFSRLGPRDSRNRLGKGVLSQIPIVQFLPEEIGDPRPVPESDLSRIYTACDVATWPRVPAGTAPARWRAWVVLLFNCGPRRDDALGLTVENLATTSRGLVLRWRAKKTGKKQTVPVNPVVEWHLRQLPAAETLIGFPNCHRDLYRTWNSILAAAGISERYTFHDVRRSCATAFDLISESAAELVLGHAKTVTRRSYANSEEKIFAAAQALRQPEAFTDRMR